MTTSSTELTLYNTALQTASSIHKSGQKTQLKAGMAMLLQTFKVSCNLALIYLISKSIDNIDTGSSNGKVNIGHKEAEYLIYSGMVLIGAMASNASSRLLTAAIKAEYAIYVNSGIEKKFSELDLDYTLTHPLGSFVQLIQHGYATQEAVPLWIDEMYPATLELLLANAALLVIDWQLGLALMGALSISATIVFLGTKAARSKYQAQEEAAFVLYRSLIAKIQDHGNIRLFGRVEKELQKGMADLQRYGTHSSKVAQLPEYNGLAQGIWASFVFTIIISILAARKDNERLSVNDFPMILIYLILIGKLFDQASRATSNLLVCGARMSEINKFMLMPINNPDQTPPRPFKITDQTSSIEFANVSFRYDKETILDNVSFTIAPGSHTAIIGLSGTGKTTITQLILRNYAPESGTVKIANHNVKTIKTQSLCTVVGLVPQHPRFPNGSLESVLRDAQPNATEAELCSVLKKVSLSEFATPQGLARILGENGLKLSGGQMQRIAIARGLLREPYILIFDEPTSALDMDTAMSVTTTVNTETIGITTLFITHNLLSISTRHADNIIVLAAGKVVQQGTFDQLLAQPSGHFYRSLQNCCQLNGIDIRSIIATHTKNTPPKQEKTVASLPREFSDEHTMTQIISDKTNLRSSLLENMQQV